MRPIILAAMLFAPLIGCTTPANGPQAGSTLSVSFASQHIRALHGKTVRIRGLVNECMSLTCLLCDDVSETAACLPLELWADSDAAGDLLEELYRFAEISVDATIDATCTLHEDPADPKPNEIIVCTDRSRALEDARVVQVWSRHAAPEGRFDAYEGEPLRLYAGQDRAAILNTFEGLWKNASQDPPQAELLAPDSPESDVTLCVCLEDSCAGRWPAMSGHVVRSPANPYVCYAFKRTDFGWALIE
jgi:hypothetical protein